MVGNPQSMFEYPLKRLASLRAVAKHGLGAYGLAPQVLLILYKDIKLVSEPKIWKKMTDRGKEPVREEARTINGIWASQEKINQRIDELAADV
ncbi:hypothetical protein KFK09_013543 [Dendrobium nobile]|uniref:Uncharacterized protein n=1 Tax=Dendrobium nobile TaxID=94219 RepID=A0A8T3B9D1_DENNO|nr:hypothetical protein KFK09_013543 [Dendrobium nobile]